MPWRIGVDIGGTFTDVALVEENSGRIAVAKVLTTPPDFGTGVMEGLREGLSRHGIAAADATLLSHATTVVTNALLEGKGAEAAFVATRGFRDVLELRRGARRRVAHVLLPERQPRAAPRRTPARRPAGRAGLPVGGGAAGDTRVRARQHHGGLRLC